MSRGLGDVYKRQRVITDETTGKTYQAAPLPAFVQGIVDNGGLLKSLKARGAAK